MNVELIEEDGSSIEVSIPDAAPTPRVITNRMNGRVYMLIDPSLKYRYHAVTFMHINKDHTTHHVHASGDIII